MEKQKTKHPDLFTERLLLRTIRPEDAEQVFHCWMNDPDVSRYMWWNASDDRAEAERFTAFELSKIEDELWYRWILVEKTTERIVGTCLIYWNDDDPDPHWDISYNLGKSYWGKGYTTEAMRAVLAFAEETLGMRECITSYAKINAASANVLHKLGFVDEEEIPYECSGGAFVTEGVRCRLATAVGNEPLKKCCENQ